jgi:dihydroxy-acid dehydratase
MLNRISKQITQNPENGAAMAMKIASGYTWDDFNKPIVGICSMWFQDNPCNDHLMKISNNVAKSFENKDIKSVQFNTIGISDGQSMGTEGMRYSLPSREIITDSIESFVNGHHHDGLITIPGCDKNVPASIMGMLRTNRPSFMIPGGSIKAGSYKGQRVDIVSAFRSYGQMLSGEITKEERKEILSCACNGSGGCAGMYTYNTMTIMSEVMGLTLPNASSNLAESPEKIVETAKSYDIMLNLLKMDLKPKDIINKESISNACKMLMLVGGSTNAVLHLIGIAKTANIDFTIDDISRISKQTPLIGNFQPYGKYLMNDLYNAGGTSRLIKYLIEEKIINGDMITITGKTLNENLKDVIAFYDFNEIFKMNRNELDNILDHLSYKKMIHRVENPIKKDGHIHILKGNLAPLGAVAKITGKEGTKFCGKAIVFESEQEMVDNINKIKKGHVIVIRNVGPKGGPGMPEMLKPTSLINGLGLDGHVALITDGRFSGGSSGFIIGHITPEAFDDGPISKLENDDIIEIDCENDTIQVNEEVLSRQKQRKFKKEIGYLEKFRQQVSNASEGCVTI